MEKGDNLMEEHASDIHIIDLYASLGRLVVSGPSLPARFLSCLTKLEYSGLAVSAPVLLYAWSRGSLTRCFRG